MSTQKRLGWALAIGVGALGAGHGAAEDIVMMRGGGIGWGGPMVEPTSTNRTDGFSVAAGATDIEDTPAPALFAAIENEDWLVAIRLLETLAQDGGDTLIRDNTGMLRPLSALREQLLADLAAEGRRTFCSMYDPLADKLLRDALAAKDADEQESLLTRLVEGYALCEAAAAGADRLGDLSFERGRFTEASRHYAFAAGHADGDPDDAALLSKRLHAMARAGNWGGFDTLARYAMFRRGDVPVRLAGEERPLSEVIEALAATRTQNNTGPILDGGPALQVPAGLYPAFDLELADPHAVTLLQQALANQRMTALADAVSRPTIAAANGRAYTLCFGQLRALDPGTGETIWTNGDGQTLAGQLAGQSHLLRQGYHQSLQPAGDRLVVTAHDPRYIGLVRLRVHDTATGELRWTTADAGEWTQRSFIGRPAIAGNTLYAVTKEQNGNRLALAALNLDDGAVQWSLDLGQAAIDPDWGEPRRVEPRIAVGERHVVVLTNNGALIAIDPNHQEVAWALTYGILPGPGRNNMLAPDGQPGNLAIQNGLVLSKDSRDNQLIALRESDTVRMWSAKIDPGATLVHTDSRHAYLLGDELVAIDLASGERAWWTSHHGSAGLAPAFTATHALIAGPRRTCRIDLATGKVDGYREDIPAGPSGSPVILLNDGVAVIGPTGVRIYETDADD